MTLPTISEGTDPKSVRKGVSVQAPQAVAWRGFTEKMGALWPQAYCKIGKANAVDAVIEPRAGGCRYERGDDGNTCQWGNVLVWEPHSRLVLSWDIGADWQYDPTLKTEIKVRFNTDGSERTRVELEHRHLDRYGSRRDEMRRIFDSEGDWGKLLEMFARVAAEAQGGKNMSGYGNDRYKMGHLLNARVPAIGFREEGLLEPGRFQSEPSPKLLHRRSYYRSAPRSNWDLTISVQRTTWKVRFQRVSGKKCTRTWPIHASL
jgi:hypothetical protein